MRRILGCLVFLLATLGLPGATVADEPSQAGLIIEFGDGRVETRCITFEEDEITGADLLLTYSGLEAIVDASSGMGITVCRLEGEGCAYPSEACFCQCMGGGECAYWNYFFREPGSNEWTYSALGAVLRKVRHGSVEAWVWGDGTMPPTFDGTFASICATPTAAPTAAKPTATAELPTATPAAAATLASSPEPPEPAQTPAAANTVVPPASTPVQPASTPAQPTSTPVQAGPTQTPEPGASSAVASYWPFGLMVLGLVAIGLFVRRRGA